MKTHTYLISFSPRNGTKSLTTCSSISSIAKKESCALSHALSTPRTFAISRIDFVFLGLYQRRRRLKPSETSSKVTLLSCGRDARLITKKTKRAMMMIFIPALISRIFSLTTSLWLAMWWNLSLLPLPTSHAYYGMLKMMMNKLRGSKNQESFW